MTTRIHQLKTDLEYLAPALLAVLPLWLLRYPLLVDLPQYAAHVRLFDDMLSQDFPYRHLFFFDLFQPYLLGYALAWLLFHVTGAVIATKLVLSLALAGLPFVTGLILRKRGGDATLAWLTLPASYGFCYVWGFVNFLLAVPIGVWLIHKTIEHIDNPRTRSALHLIVVVHLLFFSHFLALVMFGGIAGLIAVVKARDLRALVRNCWPLALIFLVGLPWGIGSLRNDAQTGLHMIWDLGLHRFLLVPYHLLGIGQPLQMAAMMAALVGLPILGGARLSRAPERWLPLAICVLSVFFVPHWALGIFFLYERFAMALVPLYLLALEFPANPDARRRKMAHLFTVLLGSFWLGYICVRAMGNASESRDFPPVLDAMQPGKRVLSLVHESGSRFTTTPAFLHYPVWYQAEKGGVVDFNFSMNYNEPVRYRLEYNPPANHDFVWRPKFFDWDDYQGASYDYFVVRDSRDPRTDIPGLNNCNLRLLLRSGSWWLFENTHVNVPGGTPCEADMSVLDASGK